MDANVSEAELERLLAHSGWLTALARRLVSDPAAADDLVQDTWHAALRSRPTDLRSERGWLATLLANLARARARGDDARRRRERDAARREAIDGPDALVERAESQRKLLAHVLALDEPYRGTLLARFVDGRTPAEIARATGVNESTVRTRLARALERLRERLAKDERNDPRLGLGALIGTGRIGQGTLATASTLAGAWIMSTGTKLALTGVAALAAWFAWTMFVGETSLEPAAANLAGGERPNVLAPAESSPELEQRQAVQSPAAEAPADPQPSNLNVSPAPVTVLDALFTRDDVPLPGVAAWLIPESRSGWLVPGRKSAMAIDILDLDFEWPADSPRATSDRNGVASFADLPRAYWFVGFETKADAARPSRLVLSSMLSGHPQEIRLGTAIVHGRVLDDLGRPRAGVGIMVAPRQADPKTKSSVTALAETDARGEYRVTDLWASDYVYAGGQLDKTGYDVVVEVDRHFEGRGDVQRKSIELRSGEVREVDFGGEDGRWSGRLLNAFEEPFPGTPSLHMTLAADTLTVPVDADGRFRVNCDPGRWRVFAHAAGCPQSGFFVGDIDVPARDFSQDLIVPGTRVQGRVQVAREGEELPDQFLVSFHLEGHDYPAAFCHATTSNDGSYVIDGLSPGVWVVGIWPGALDAPTRITVGEQVRALDLDLRWLAR